MVRRALAACFCLLLTAFPALAAGENATFFLREDEKSPVALSLCAHEGALYIVCEEGIYAYRPGDEAPERVADYVFGCWIAGDDGMYAPDERIRPTPDLLYSQGGKLYGVNTSYAQFGEVEMGAAWALRDPVALDCLDYAPDGSLYLEKSWLEGDILYASVYGVAGDCLSLLAIDAKSGETAPLPGSEHREAAPYKPGSALLLCEGDSAPRLLAYDLRSGEAKEIHAFGCAEDEPNGLAYDASSDTIYCAQGGALCALRPGAQGEVVNYISGDMAFHDALMWEGRYTCRCYDGVYLRGVDPAQRSERVLRIEGFSDHENVAGRFAARHPETPVDLSPNITGDAASAMLSGAADVDIYGLWTDEAQFSALRERGYLLDLSGSDVIRETVAAMPENFQSVLRKGDQVLAVPVRVSEGGVWGYSPAVLSQLGLEPGDLPQTWPQFLDFLAAWPETFGISHPDFSPFSDLERAYGDLPADVFESFLNAYLADCARSGAAPAFDGEEFRAVVEALSRLNLQQYQFSEAERQAFDLAMQDESEELALHPSGLFDLGRGDLFLDETMNRSVWAFDLMPLSVAESSPPVYPASMWVLIVNPHSQNVDLALQFLEEYCHNLNGALKLNLMAAFDEPLVDPRLAERVKRIDQQIAEYEEVLKTCAESMRAQYQSAQAALRQMRDEFNAYVISAEDIAQYRARQGLIRFDGAAAFVGQGREDVKAVCRRFLEGGMSVDELVGKLQQTAYMMQLEGY